MINIFGNVRVLLCVYIDSLVYLQDIHTKHKINKRKNSCMSVLFLCICEAMVIEDWLRFSSPEVIFYRARIITFNRCILGDRRRENLEHRRRGGESVLRKACDTCASTSC